MYPQIPTHQYAINIFLQFTIKSLKHSTERLWLFIFVIIVVDENYKLSIPLFQKTENDMPPYFRFLTVMAFNVFLSERVDVAIVEVGIGGENDCTNILR